MHVHSSLKELMEILGVAREDWASGKHGASVDRLRLQSFPFLRGIRNGIRDEYLCTHVYWRQQRRVGTGREDGGGGRRSSTGQL